MRENQGASRSQTIARGGAYLIIAQVIVGITQIVGSGVVSRLLFPDAFGKYAVALSAVALLSLVMTSGLPSAILSLPDLNRGQITAANVIAVLAGIVAAILMVFGGPLWSYLWGQPGAAPILALLGLHAALLSPAVVQLALLRREGRPGADALIQIVAAILGALAGVVAVAASRTTESLVVNPTVTTITTLLLAWTCRRVRFRPKRPAQLKELAHFSGNVASQTLLFWMILTCPSWVISVATNASILGYFSRAVVLVGVPSMALTSALVRAFQPFYRHIPMERRSKALSDSLLAVALLVLPPFCLVALMAPEVVSLWLGNGWDETARAVSVIAPGYAIYTIFSVIANYAEVNQKFAQVRNTQIVMIAVLVPLILLSLYSDSAVYALWIIPAVSVVGLIFITASLSRARVFEGAALSLVRLGVQAAWSSAIVGAAFVCSTIAGRFEGMDSPFFKITIATILLAFGVATTLRFQPAAQVLLSRQLVPQRFASFLRLKPSRKVADV